MDGASDKKLHVFYKITWSGL